MEGKKGGGKVEVRQRHAATGNKKQFITTLFQPFERKPTTYAWYSWMLLTVSSMLLSERIAFTEASAAERLVAWEVF